MPRTGPKRLRQAESEALAAFAREEPRAIDFSMYLQWCASEQLDSVASAAKAHGVALYRDLAVGVESGGSEAWGGPDYVTSASVGAPPDLLNTARPRLGPAAALAGDAGTRRLRGVRRAPRQ